MVAIMVKITSKLEAKDHVRKVINWEMVIREDLEFRFSFVGKQVLNCYPQGSNSFLGDGILLFFCGL